MRKDPERGVESGGDETGVVRHRFTVHLGGLIELLSDALYTSETVFVRELIQNAVDAISARKVIEPDWKGRVEIQCFQGDDGRWRLSVEDDGIGLSEEEIHEFLATIGASMKRGDLEQRRNESFIGQFGIGFLSCFMVADEVALVTRRAGVEGSKSLKWEGCKDGTYTLEELTGDRPCGACVYVTLKEDTREVYSGERLLALARKYAGFLAVPIDFSSAETERVRLNPEPFPWLKAEKKRGRQQKAWITFAEQTLKSRFLAAFPIQCEEGGVRGIACVLKESVGALDTARHMVFLKGMFLSREIEGVAPKEMPFLRCIVNATGLKPNAAREGLQDAECSLIAVRSAVRARFFAFLSELDTEDPMLLREIVDVHNRSFLALAAEDDQILDLVGSHLRFETSLGLKTLEEMSQNSATTWFIDSYEDFKRGEGFASSHDILVVNAGYSGIDRLMRRIARGWPRGCFQETNSRKLHNLFAREVDYSPALRGLLKRAQEALRKVRASATLVADPRGRVAATIEISLAKSLGRGAVGLPDFLSELEGEDSAKGNEIVLKLNTAHPLIQLIADLEIPECKVHAVIGILYHHALVASREIPSTLEDQVFDQSLQTLLLGGGETTT